MSTTWTASTLQTVVVYYEDSLGNVGHSRFHAAPGATSGQIQAIVNAFQALSDLSIISYELLTTYVASGQPAANPFGSSHPFATLQEELRLEFSAGPNVPVTRTTIFGPIASELQTDTHSNINLNPAATGVSTMTTAAVAAMVNSGGNAVTQLIYGRLYGKRHKRI